MIFFDTETTGLVMPAPAKLEDQPHIIEFGALKVDKNLNEIDSMNFLCDPGIDLPPIITKITGIRPSDLKGKSLFKRHIRRVIDFFEGEKTLCAHNASFDTDLLFFELLRMGMEKKFPWPTNHICTVEQTMHISNKRMSLENLHKYVFGKLPGQTHRAIDDARLLLKVYKGLVAKELIQV